jgi:hypothetical protein
MVSVEHPKYRSKLGSIEVITDDLYDVSLRKENGGYGLTVRYYDVLKWTAISCSTSPNSRPHEQWAGPAHLIGLHFPP